MMKYAFLFFFVFALILFGIAAYYHFIKFDEILHQRFMGLGTVALVLLFVPCFLIWRHLKRQKEKKDS